MASLPEADWVPRPDPTLLTTEQLRREVGALEDRVESQFAAFKEITNLQFNLISEWRLEQKDDTRVKVEAALQAQEKAITKQETATDRQLEQLRLTFTTATGELRRNFDDLKARVGAIESVKVGGQETKAALYALVGVIGTLIVIGGFVAALWPR